MKALPSLSLFLLSIIGTTELGYCAEFSVQDVSGSSGTAQILSNLTTRVVERGRNHQVVEHVDWALSPSGAGTASLVTNYVTVLGQGMEYQDASGQWVESRPVITSYSGGIVCTGASYRVILSQNLNQAGSVDLQALDGERVVSHPLALYFYDPESGKSVLVGQIQDCQAEVESANHEVIYRDAFAPMNNSGIEAAVTYRYEAGRFCQDVTLTRKPAVTPADFGLGSRTRLEVASEILSSPPVTKETHVWHTETNATVRARMADPDVVDETLTFGPELTMTLGRAFSTAASGGRPPGVPVAKRLVEIQGRTLLLESIEWDRVKNEVENLPGGSSGATTTTNQQARLRRELPQIAMNQDGSGTPVLTAKASFESRLREVSRSTELKTTLVAFNHPASQSPPQGFVLDYPYVIGGYYNGFTFYPASYSTYLVLSYTTICGATFQPGAVIKYARGAELDLTCDVNFPSSGEPIVFTAEDDNSPDAGEPLGNGNPTGYYANWAMYCYYINNPPITASHLDIRYAASGFYSYLCDANISCSSFQNCQLGLYADSYSTIILSGVTMQNVTTPWDANYNGGGQVVDAGNPQDTANSQNVMTGKGRSVAFTLSGAGCGDFTVVQGSGPSHAQSFSLSPYGSVAYTPYASFEGVDSFEFKVGNSQPATVTIFVVAGPTLTAQCNPNGPGILLNWSLDSIVQQMQNQGTSGFYISDFKIFRATSAGGPYGAPIATVSGAESSYLDVTVSPNDTYYYVITFEYEDPYTAITYPTFGPAPNVPPYSAEANATACCPPPQGANGIDVAFIVDNTTTMGSALTAAVNAITNVLDDIICASGNNNYRFALVTPDTDGDQINGTLDGHDLVDVRVPFTDNVGIFLDAITDPNLQGTGSNLPESTDECLNTVVNEMAADGRRNTKTCSVCSGTQSNPLQIGDFTDWNPDAVKLVVLITDAAPGGFCDCFDCSRDPQRVHLFAQAAYNGCIHINAIMVGDGSNSGDNGCSSGTQSIMQDYANTSCGWYEQVSNSPSTSEVAVAILNMLYTAGACNCQ